MTKEFKKIANKSETRYVLESMTAGGTGASSIASVPGTIGKGQKRGNLLAQEGNKDKVDASKPRNFVAKNAKMGGAGAHKDKKKAQKQGTEKHKKPFAESIAELKDKFESLKEAGQYVRPGNPLAYGRDYAASRTGFGRRGADVTGEEEPEGIFTVMINGKPWKTGTSNEAFKMAQSVANKYPDRQVAVKWPNGALNTVKAFKVAEGAEFGSFYNENIASKVFSQNPDLKSEDDILNAAWEHVVRDMGSKRARHLFNYNEDFPSDLVSSYAYLQKQQQGVAEGDIEQQHGDTKPWAYWGYPERVAKKLYQIHKGQPISKAEVVKLWKEDGPDRMTKFMLKPDMAAILSAYEQMSDSGPLFREGSTPKDAKAPKKVQDRKTGKWYDPTKEFDKTMNKPEVKSQMKRMATKESTVNELNYDTLRSYSDKADDQIVRKHRVLGPQIKAGDANAANKTAGTIQKRMSGIDKAAKRMNKEVDETAPKGWEGTVKAMKKHKEIDNPYALTNYMKNKGYKSHKPAKESADPYFESLTSKLNDLKKK